MQHSQAQEYETAVSVTQPLLSGWRRAVTSQPSYWNPTSTINGYFVIHFPYSLSVDIMFSLRWKQPEVSNLQNNQYSPMGPTKWFRSINYVKWVSHEDDDKILCLLNTQYWHFNTRRCERHWGIGTFLTGHIPIVRSLVISMNSLVCNNMQQIMHHVLQIILQAHATLSWICKGLSIRRQFCCIYWLLRSNGSMPTTMTIPRNLMYFGFWSNPLKQFHIHH